MFSLLEYHHVHTSTIPHIYDKTNKLMNQLKYAVLNLEANKMAQ